MSTYCIWIAVKVTNSCSLRCSLDKSCNTFINTLDLFLTPRVIEVPHASHMLQAT
jgi:hypothetical protein